ncbi:MAG: hypothetical protein DYG98_24035 [Haliscomenobacteraceae bacterium CHB4]|nr:hypothetical protein [Saprospiraceae bacterium]MCE7926128.1 hypothetical protein [Haliscomenobacteraceae bacterium CHB4]
MKFSIKSLLLLLVVSTFAFVACKGDDDKSAEELLAGASCWSLVKDELYNPATSQWEDQGVDDCTKDDCTKLNSDKTVSFDEGATKCDPDDPQTSTGTWSISADGKTLTLTVDGETLAGTIIELSASKLVLETDFLGFKIRSTLEAK